MIVKRKPQRKLSEVFSFESHFYIDELPDITQMGPVRLTTDVLTHLSERYPTEMDVQLIYFISRLPADRTKTRWRTSADPSRVNNVKVNTTNLENQHRRLSPCLPDSPLRLHVTDMKRQIVRYTYFDSWETCML
jgi:hypothetical protein